MKTQFITIHAEAPAKPALGLSCNGCGVCCAAEPCPISIAFLWPHRAPCKALEWNNVQKRYFCGMVTRPAHYLRWLPIQWNNFASRQFKRWIAANTRCDADVSLET